MRRLYKQRQRTKPKSQIKHYYRKLLRKSITLFALCMFIVIIGLYTVMEIDETLGECILYVMTIPTAFISVLATKSAFYKINRLDMLDDVNCWGSRIIGGSLIIVAAVVFVVSGMIAFMHIIGYVTVFVAIEIGLVGLFAEYRSIRRYGTFVYVR